MYKRQGARPLNPVFIDRDELATSADLSRSITSALDQSDALVVVCSPSSRASPWVDREIRYFQDQGKSGRIFCLLVAGVPDRDHSDCAFPESLLVSAEGSPVPEPLAADARQGMDSQKIAFLRIAAGILETGFDELRQRDTTRQLRNRSIVATLAFLIAVITTGFAISAQLAREEAEVRLSLIHI